MKVLLDTSVLTAALVRVHPAHPEAIHWLRRIQNKDADGFINVHALAELYSNLTRIPFEPRLQHNEIEAIYEHNFRDQIEVVSLSRDDYLAVIQHLRQMDLSGGIIYDALHVYTGIKCDVDLILTLNPKHFRMVYPESADRVVEP